VPGGGVEHVRGEAGALVGGQRPRVVGQDFQRQLAAAEFARPLLGGSQPGTGRFFALTGGVDLGANPPPDGTYTLAPLYLLELPG